MTQKELTSSIKSEFGRMTGRTTRIVDDFVQMLYRNEGKLIMEQYIKKSAVVAEIKI